MTFITQARRAPGQHGGKPWKGPRERLTVRVPVDVAVILRLQARAEGVPINDHVSAVLSEVVSNV